MNYKYLLDSNVLATSPVMELIDTDFFRESCVVVSEIAYELSDASVGDKIRVVAVTPSVATLNFLQNIVDDLVRLGLLKTDHGNGEALLLAEALSMKSGNANQLSLEFVQDQPVVVTNEKLVDVYAKSKGLQAINGREFIDIATAAIANSRH